MITIKTLEVPGAIGLRAVVAKLRSQSGCGTDPDGYYTYRAIPNKGYGDRDNVAFVPSQYFLGKGDIEVITNFLYTDKFCSSCHRRRRQCEWHKAIEGLYAEFELTAPVTFWAVNGFRDLMLDMDMNPNWDLSKYGEVPVEEFLESLTLTGHATFDYHTLASLRRRFMECNNDISKVLVPWIEQLPYADIFICNEAV